MKRYDGMVLNALLQIIAPKQRNSTPYEVSIAMWNYLLPRIKAKRSLIHGKNYFSWIENNGRGDVQRVHGDKSKSARGDLEGYNGTTTGLLEDRPAEN